MNFSLSPRRRFGAASNARAFTLIELLVVIAIIAILAGLLLPVVSNVMIKAKAVETKNTAVQVVTAIKSYQTEYGTYPIPTTATADVTYQDTDSNAGLFSILQAVNADYITSGLNSRRIRYFEYKDSKSLTAPKAGFVPPKATAAKDNLKRNLTAGDLVDSFGDRFFIRMDGNYNDFVLNPYTATGTDDTGTYDANTFLRTGVIVWSYGNDNLIGKKGIKTDVGDDLVSWQ